MPCACADPRTRLGSRKSTSGANGCNVGFCRRQYAALPPVQAAFLVTGLAILLVLGSGTSSMVAASVVTAYRDTVVDETRTVPAYLSPADPDRLVRLHTVRFWARAGEKRYVTSEVVGWQPTTTPDSLLMAAVSVSCSPGVGVTTAGATQNLLRGTAARFNPRFVFTAARTGMAACRLDATGSRPRPLWFGSARKNVWRVRDGSFLSVSRPLPRWSRNLTSSARSRVLDPGERWAPVARTVRVGDVRSFELVSDHKVTTCSATGGSRDATTLGKDMCTHRVSRAGSTYRLVVTASQRRRSGAPCGDRQVVVSRRTRVAPDVHHRMLFSKGLVRVSRAPGCVPTFRVVGTIVHLHGADLMVHAPSERTAVLPG
jgi:hypothetical protein